MRSARVLLTVAALSVAGLALGGCFELTANSDFRKDGTAKAEVEFAISMQGAAMMAGLAKDKGNADPMHDCETKASEDNSLPSGIRWVKGVRGTRGDMLTCTMSFELDDPVKAAKAWKPNMKPGEGPFDLKMFRFERLSDSSYRLAALIEANPQKPDDAAANPFVAMFLTAMANRYVTISISAAKIENTTGELDKDGRRATWKMPVALLIQPPPGYKQEIRADIVYEEGGWLGIVEAWFGSAKRALGLESAPSPSPSSSSPPPMAEAAKPKTTVSDAAALEQRARLAAELAKDQAQLAKVQAALAEAQAELQAVTARQTETHALTEKLVITDARFRYEKGYAGNEPAISFALTNNGGIPVKSIHVASTLQTPGRSVPWLTEPFSYEIRGGLEPGERKKFDLAPNRFTEWGKVPSEVVGTAVLTLKLTAFEDPSGKKIGSDINEEEKRSLDKAAERVKSLEAEKQGLETKVVTLKQQLGAP
jgi:hypothetical protein